ncbi:MAG: cyclase family protein [Thermomicrobiales bacterium]
MSIPPSDPEIIDVTIPCSPGIRVWPTHRPVVMDPLRRIAQGAPSNVTLLALTSHAGTHVDANWHFIDNGRRLDEIPLSRWNGPCFVARIPDEIDQIGVADLETAGVPSGVARLLLHTRNSREWASWDGVSLLPFREDYVAVLPDAARWIVAQGINLVGIDYLSVGPFGERNIETHQILLGNDVLIIETIDLSHVSSGPYRLTCLPLKLSACDGAPARVVLERP